MHEACKYREDESLILSTFQIIFHFQISVILKAYNPKKGGKKESPNDSSSKKGIPKLFPRFRLR